jgi:pimeloyl-ACP methyl ester carboxylesterase
MRGYAPTGVPADGCYQPGALVADAMALHEALGGDDRAVLVGHDWGAMAAYGTGAFAPDRWSRLVTLAVPPPAALATAFFDYAQAKRSFYIFLFQTALAEAAVLGDGLAFLEGLWRDWTPPSYDASDDVRRVKESLRSPANVSAAIGYYRAMFDASTQSADYAAEQAACAQLAPQPTLYLHGTNDAALGAEVIGDALKLLSDGSKVEMIVGANHFLHVEQPDVVNPLILSWLTD